MRNLRVMTAVAAALLLAGAASAAFAQDRLPVSSRRPTIDGIVRPGEYTYSHDFDGQITLYASRTPTTLYLAVAGSTRGWVAVGVGQYMDGADIFMGFVKDGRESFKPQLGSGHTHHDAPVSVDNTVEAYSLKQRGGKTTLEVALRAGAYIRTGQSALNLIFAMGDQANYYQYHSYRNLTSLPLE